MKTRTQTTKQEWEFQKEKMSKISNIIWQIEIIFAFFLIFFYCKENYNFSLVELCQSLKITFSTMETWDIVKMSSSVLNGFIASAINFIFSKSIYN